MKEIKSLIDQLNRAFTGKKLLHCPLLGSILNFNYDGLTFCCSSTTEQSPVVCEAQTMIAADSAKDCYLENLIRTIYANQETVGPCVGCKHLREMDYQAYHYDDLRLSHLIYNNFRGCNSKCVYCDEKGAVIREYYQCAPLVQRLYEEGFVADNAKIDFGGGEPTMLPDLGEYLAFGLEHNMQQLVNTSGLLFSEDIYNGLEQGSVRVQISPDAGTPETYYRVKRQKGFELVWRNIRKYCDFPDRVTIKYIVFSWNSSKDELESFVALCAKNRVKNVVVSGESNAAWGNMPAEKLNWAFGQEEAEACAYLMRLCVENQIAVSLSSGNLSKANESRAAASFISGFSGKQLGANIYIYIYIYGMGENGKKICDYFRENGILVDGFWDGDPCKHGSTYQDVTCFPVPDQPFPNTRVIISNSNYEPILDMLRRLGYQDISVFHF